MLARIGLAGAVAANVMAIAFALYGGAFHGMEPEYASLFRWASLAITVPSVIWGGGVFFRGAWAALRMRTLHMDLPISIGLLAGFLHGAVNTLRGAGDVYFDSVTALIFLLLAGRYVQRRQQRAAADSAELLAALAPSAARLIEAARRPRGAARGAPAGRARRSAGGRRRARRRRHRVRPLGPRPLAALGRIAPDRAPDPATACTRARSISPPASRFWWSRPVRTRASAG